MIDIKIGIMVSPEKQHGLQRPSKRKTLWDQSIMMNDE